jgi:hypothetical protein
LPTAWIRLGPWDSRPGPGLCCSESAPIFFWPLLSTSVQNFLWTLLYLNSSMTSERIAGRLLCNSAAV